MPFIELTINGDVKATINTDHILFAEPNGSRSKLNWVSGGHLHVQESYDQVREQLSQYTVLSVEESIGSGTLEEAANGLIEASKKLLEQQAEDPSKTDQQLADELAKARQAEEIAKTEEQLAAEAAKIADSGNPAKKRETKS